MSERAGKLLGRPVPQEVAGDSIAFKDHLLAHEIAPWDHSY